MENFIHENTTYILSDYILQNAPVFCKGCRSSRDLLRKKNITQDKYIFVRKNKKTNEMTISDGSSPKVDRVFIIESYLQEIPELNNTNTEQKIVDEKGIEKAPEIIYLKESEKFRDENGNSLDIETRGVRECNGIYFRVKDVERCFDMKNLHDIITKSHTTYTENIDYKYFIYENMKKELFITYSGLLRFLFNTRDDRTKEKNIVDNIIKYTDIKWSCNKKLFNLSYRPDMYFIRNKVLYIVEIDEFQHKNYKRDMNRTTDIQSLYENIILFRINPDNYTDSKNIKHCGIYEDNDEFNYRMNIIIKNINSNLYTNVNGLNIIKLFYDNYDYQDIEYTHKFEYIKNERYNRICMFRDRIIRGSFFQQMGTEEQKNQLVANIKGVSYESIQEIFSVSSTDLPCIYLTHLNDVKTLRQEMKLDEKYNDNDIVFKFGLTKSFKQRKYGHKSEFKKISHLIDMKICCFSWIDPLYISQAETELKTILNEYKIVYDKTDELVVLSSSTLRLVKTLYENISKKFSGHTHELNEKIKQIEHENELLKKDKEYEIYKISKDKDFEILRLEKELEIAQLKLQLVQNKVNIQV